MESPYNQGISFVLASINPGNHFGIFLAALLSFAGGGERAQGADEWRALWVDAFHGGIKTPSQTAQLVADARAGNFNAIVVQVRKRGDAYYESTFEPRATDISPSGYDPLADLISQAHAGPEPLQVHAWIVSYNIWNSENGIPAQPDHPFRLHPEWLTFNENGTQWDGANYQFDPALPAVQKHTFDVVMDLVTRYAIDGVHFDYIRYSESGSPGNHSVWGYHPEAVARFNTLQGRSGIPAAGDAAWLQFRRDQVTALVRKTWLSVLEARPEVCVSAACITFGNAPTSATASAFAVTEPYRRVLQDWRGWLEEGILDLAIPMIYRRYDTASGVQGFADGGRRAQEYQAGRAAAIGVAFYLNSIADNLTQLKIARAAVPGSGLTASGAVGYSYAVPADSGETRAMLYAALTDPASAELHTPGEAPLYLDPVSPPGMPWKSDPAFGHLLGFALDGRNQTALDGATVLLSGPETRTLRTDATGFFGAVGLVPGAYMLTVSFPGLPDLAQSLVISGGGATRRDVQLAPGAFALQGLELLESPRRVVLRWSSRAGHTYAVQASGDLEDWITLAGAIPPASGFSNTFQDAPPPAGTERYYRVVESAGP